MPSGKSGISPRVSPSGSCSGLFMTPRVYSLCRRQYKLGRYEPQFLVNSDFIESLDAVGLVEPLSHEQPFDGLGASGLLRYELER